MDTKKTTLKLLGDKIYEKGGFALYMILKKDKATLRLSVGFYLVTLDGEISTMTTIKLSDIRCKKNAFTFLLDYIADFDENDVLEISNIVDKQLSVSKNELFTSKVTIAEAHRILCDYIKDKTKNNEINTKNDYYIENNLGHIRTTLMDNFISDNKELLGYRKIELLQNLKICGLLDYGKGRSYDKQISRDGEKIRFYVVPMYNHNTRGEKECH